MRRLLLKLNINSNMISLLFYFNFCLYFNTVHGARTQFSQPEQVHLSYGEASSEMVVTWMTQFPTNESIVEYGRDQLNLTAVGSSCKFTDSGLLQRQMYIHHVVITALSPATKYSYHCGSDHGWSSLFYFQTMSSGTNWSPNFVVYGDLSNDNAQILQRLQKEAQLGIYNAVLHLGDFAYDMATDNGITGDEFMKQIEPIAAYVPYMTCVGDHEYSYNFSNYINRMRMPGSSHDLTRNMFYSWNIGPAHIVAFSTEFYFYVEFGWQQIVQQYKWLEKDLQEANDPRNRSIRPWIITMGHRPMYCSNDGSHDCQKNDSVVRTGIPRLHLFGLEDLFYKHGVDLELWAHQDSYERLWPIYNRTVYNGSYSSPYTNPKAPVHITIGTAGSQSGKSPFAAGQPPWSAFRSDDYGFSRMVIINNTHLFLEQISQDQEGAVIDRVMIMKEKHGAEAWL